MFFILFFCNQKTAYELRISDWSSDVCSSDLSRAISVAGYRVELDLRSAVDSAVKTFSTVTTIDLTSSVESTWLDFIGAAVDSVDVDGASIPVEYDGSRWEERRVGKECVSTCRSRGWAYLQKTQRSGKL